MLALKVDISNVPTNTVNITYTYVKWSICTITPHTSLDFSWDKEINIDYCHAL